MFNSLPINSDSFTGNPKILVFHSFVFQQKYAIKPHVLQYLKLIVFIFALDITIKMTITQLKYVLAAEHKNFTLAAEKCFVTQPTLSMQIQKNRRRIKYSDLQNKKTNSIN
jgi:hypothetical protein